MRYVINEQYILECIAIIYMCGKTPFPFPSPFSVKLYGIDKCVCVHVYVYINVQIFIQYIFSRISHRALDAWKYEAEIKTCEYAP